MKKIKQFLKPLYHWLLRTIKFYRRIGLRNRSFSIISNNCTGGYIYQYFGLIYNTPTAGIFFEASDYIKLVSDPAKYLRNSKLEFINPFESKNIGVLKSSYSYGTYPVAKLNDIEIYFMHYHKKENAEKVWYRRVTRINYDNLFFLFTENESFTKKTLIDFINIPSSNKLCLVNKDYEINNSFVRIDNRAKISDGNYAWTPTIILSAIPWKKVLNRLQHK